MRFEDTDLIDPAAHTRDPEPFYEWLREEAPLFQDKANGLWAVSRYEDVVYVSKHPELFCSGDGALPLIGADDWPDEAMINLDGAEHTRQRALINKGFTPRRISGMKDTALSIMNGLIDRFAERGHADLIREYARPLPMYIIGNMLGYTSREKMDALLDWTDVYMDAGSGPSHITEDVVENFAKFCEFHEEVLEERKKKRGDDLISVWLDAELDGEKLSEDKLLYEHNLVMVGGSETTRSAVSIGMKMLIQNQDQLLWLQENLDDDEVIATAAEEMIRWSCPFVRMRRTATQDVELHGRTVKKGDQILMMYPAANRDPRAFDSPQVFDIRRQSESPSLSFGHGKHFCIGASLARLEVRFGVRELLKRLGDFALVEAKPPKPHLSSFTNGLDSLDVTFRAR